VHYFIYLLAKTCFMYALCADITWKCVKLHVAARQWPMTLLATTPIFFVLAKHAL